MELIIIIILNLFVGGCIGLCGIAGFLLPIAYTGLMKMPMAPSLALSFMSFLISGVIGSLNYRKLGKLDFMWTLWMSMGSFAGAFAGVQINQAIPAAKGKQILYFVVLASGLSILVREYHDRKKIERKDTMICLSKAALIVLGFVTGGLCSLSGAGGPVLVMPLLVVLGMDAHCAVGTALLNSVFIALPSFIGYMAQCDIQSILLPLFFGGISHGLGVYIGSKNAGRIRQGILKTGVALISAGIASYMLFKAL